MVKAVSALDIRRDKKPMVEEEKGESLKGKYTEVNLRIKPLGSGNSDVVAEDEDPKTSKKVIRHINGNVITMGNKDNVK